jgi:hypothetical protein
MELKRRIFSTSDINLSVADYDRRLWSTLRMTKWMEMGSLLIGDSDWEAVPAYAPNIKSFELLEGLAATSIKFAVG